jgi:hypothetical protein
MPHDLGIQLLYITIPCGSDGHKALIKKINSVNQISLAALPAKREGYGASDYPISPLGPA